MPDARLTRRIANMLATRLDEARFDQVPDHRDDRGQTWKLKTLLVGATAAMAAGAKSLAEAERITDTLPSPARRWLALPRRVPDTTLRDALVRVRPEQLVSSLHSVVLSAHRRKALTPGDELPFGVVSLDGKSFTLPSCDDYYAQRQTQAAGRLIGLVRTVTATLTSSKARPCIDVSPIPANTNEMGAFRPALDQLTATYGHLDLFRMVTYDAGACSLDNAAAVREKKLHYLFALKATQPSLLAAAEQWLGSRPVEQADAETQDSVRGTTVIRRIYLGQAIDAPEGWTHLHTVLRVESRTMDGLGRCIAREDRYFISSLARDRLTPEQWMSIVRGHWGVETTHQVLDVSLLEDDHPWIEADPRTALVVAVLRRIVYTLLTLFRSVTQRSEERRAVPWGRLLADIRDTLLTLNAAHLEGLRRRRQLAVLLS